METEQEMTPLQAAQRLNVSKATLCRWTKAGRIPHMRMGAKVVRYNRTALEQWIKDQQQWPAPPLDCTDEERPKAAAVLPSGNGFPATFEALKQAPSSPSSLEPTDGGAPNL